jgi:DNA-binding MarR family transcriptional regulator
MSKTDDIVPLEQQLCFSVYSAAHAFTAAYKPLLEPFGLTYPQYLVLLALWQKDGVSVKEIGARLHLDSGTLTPLLKRLQASGYVRRDRDPADERQLRVELTENGRRLRGQVAGVRQSLVCALGGVEAPIQALRQQVDAVTKQLRAMPSGASSAETSPS